MRLAALSLKTSLFCLGLAFCTLLAPATSQAQLSTTAPRISDPVDDTSLVRLSGTVPSLAQPQFDRGPVSPSTQLSSVRLFFSRTAEQQAELDQLLAEQVDPSSPNFRKWITPEEFGRRFGPADSDVAAIKSWLESHGLRVEPLPPGRSNIAFSGTVGQIQEAFRTTIHSFDANGRQFLANTVEPAIPGAMASVVASIVQMNTLRPRPMHQHAGLGVGDPSTRTMAPAQGASSLLSPEMTTGSAGNYKLYVTPADAATIYNSPNSFNSNFTTGTSYNGAGIKIGIAGDAIISASTVADYRKRFLGDSTQPTIFNVDNVTSTNDAGEAYIDTELSAGLAPGAAIYYYTSTDLFGAIQKAISDNTVDILSISFGECELGLQTSGNTFVNTYAQQAASQGIVITVSSGDSGSAGCDASSAVIANRGLQVNGLASTPYTVAVGGTDFDVLASAFTTYANTSSNALYGSAKGFIPEATWNNSPTTNGLLADNVAYVNTSSKTNVVAGGGGKSSCNTSGTSGCTGGYAKPSWQRGPGVPADSVRDIPDVSLLGANGRYAATWLVCTDDQGTVNGVAVTADCTTQSDNHFYFMGFGGTSTSAPAFAGMLAVVQQKVGSRLGTTALKTLYDLYNGTHATAVFHDTTVGNISVLCTQGTANCAQNSKGNYFLTGYDTTAGYDLATGLGSVDLTNLANFWTSASTTATPAISVVPTPGTVNTSQSISVAVTISGSAGTPTGTVTLTSGTYSSGAQTLTTGAYTFTIPAGTLPVGTDTLTASYSGDSNYSSGTKTATVTVTTLPAPTITVTPTPSTATTNQSISVAVTVSGTTGTPTGSVTLTSGSYTSGAQTLSSGAYTFTIPAGTLPVGTDTLTVSYAGNSSYSSGTKTATVTITALSPAVTLAPSATAIVSNQSMTVKATITGSGPTPTGTVKLTGGGYTSANQTLSAGVYTFTIPANSLSAGTDTLTVTYNGDSIYATNTSSVTVTVTQYVAPTATVTVTPAKATLFSSESLSVPVTLTGTAGAPTGTVTLSGAGYTSSAIAIASGLATVSVPANSFKVGATQTLTATYSGDAAYASTTGTATITVKAPYSMTSSATTAISRGGTATSTITITSDATYTGTLTLACALTTSPAGAVDSPACNISSGASISVTAGTPTPSTATVSITTTAAQASLQPHKLPTWLGGGSGAVLALLIFFGIPARRRSWRSLLGMLALFAALGSISACGGGGGSSTTTTTPKDPGTTPGAYVFTVTATGNPAVTPAPTATVNLTIN